VRFGFCFEKPEIPAASGWGIEPNSVGEPGSNPGGDSKKLFSREFLDPGTFNFAAPI